MRAGLALAAAALAGCASGPRYFEPTERVQGQTVEGYRVALYPLLGSAGAFGEAKVWSQGARVTDERTLVHVGFELHNTSGAPLTIGPNDVRLDVRARNGQPFSALSPLQADQHSIAAGALSDVEFEFELPPGLKPQDVVALRLHWRVIGQNQIYTQRTPFIRERIDPVYAGGPNVYSCWPYGPFDCAAAYGWSYPYGYGWNVGLAAGVWLIDPVAAPYPGPGRRVTRSYPKR